MRAARSPGGSGYGVVSGICARCDRRYGNCTEADQHDEIEKPPTGTGGHSSYIIDIGSGRRADSKPLAHQYYPTDMLDFTILAEKASISHRVSD